MIQRSIKLLSGQGQVVNGLICTMQQRHQDDFQTIWQGILNATGQPDAGWMWDYKRRQSEQENRYEAYALEAEALTQGLLFLETQWRRSQLQSPSRLVYVEALASAPWNRGSLEQPPFFRGVGRTLLLFARQRSLELGYEGRVGLHALPESEAFYRHIQMPDYGADSEKEGLVYFEYGAIQP
ncbi:hypothetical protein PGN35_017460 [Nodosilinea sp. PGN35]|uniref:hypothetical protein n=1 Tax=Nodosilinea sp. PGN35 TaxID=3020489 RepID=UPI0023B2DCA7|nr:hypothetical protein [Nodosilinea sp. TSF1-S3]MDF0369626.1 hypothetical protein [Nodosilinea sp. TSF1-S3]